MKRTLETHNGSESTSAFGCYRQIARMRQGGDSDLRDPSTRTLALKYPLIKTKFLR